MTSTINHELVEKFYKAMEVKDVDTILACMDQNITWINPLPDVIPFGGKYVGFEASVGYLLAISEAIDMNEFTIDEIFGDWDSFSVSGVEGSHVKSTGKTYRGEWIHIVKVKDGKVVYVREFNDSASMQKAFI